MATSPVIAGPDSLVPKAPTSIPTLIDPKLAIREEIDNERQRQNLTWPQVWERTGMTLTGESPVADLQEVLRRLLTS